MKKKTIIIVAVILVILIGIILLVKTSKKEYNKFTFPQTVEVKNYTKNPMSDTMMMVVLNKIMLYDTIKVNIYKYNSRLDTQDTELAGYISKNPFEKHSYILYIKDNLDFNTLENVISHESIHLQQMEKAHLIVYELGYYWKGDIKAFKDVPYGDRQYEREAFAQQSDIKVKLEKLLYK